MIIAIVNQHGSPERTVVARNLAVLRARSGRRVCLMTTAAGADSDWCNDRSSGGVRPWIDTRHVGSRAVDTRLAALRPLFNDILIDDGARVLNPGLRVLFVAVSGQAGPDANERAAVLAHVSRVQNATLASTILHAPATFDYGLGRCVSDAAACDPDAAAEMQALYDEVYATLPTMTHSMEAQMGAGHALWR